MKCVMCAKETDYFTKNKVCKECDKIYFGEEESSDFQSGGNLMIKCPVCQTKNTEEALFCKKCGVKMSAAIEAARRIKTKDSRAFMLCMSCGAENVNNSTYCIECGSLLVIPERQVISHHNKVNAPTIECPHCHQANPANNMFCTNCRKNMKYTADNQKLTGFGILGRVLGWFLWPVLAIVYIFLILIIDQAITSIGLAIGLPFDNDIAAMIIFGLVTFAIPIIIAVLFGRDWSRKK